MRPRSLRTPSRHNPGVSGAPEITNGPAISVVVPTRDRPGALGRCLDALSVQEGGPIEIVVVNDGSRDRGPVAELADAAGARVIRTPGFGPAAARNLGARAAAGAIVCFTDDDCEPATGWAASLIAAIGRSGASAAAGSTESPPGAGAAVRGSQAITRYLQLSSLEPASGRLGFAPTCNLAVARGALARVPFDDSYPSAAGEDRDWCARLLAAGETMVFAPEALVVHRQQLSGRQFARQQFRYGRGAARYRADDRERRLAGPAFYTGLLRSGFRGGVGEGAAVAAAQLFTAAGVAAERLGR